MSVPQLSTTMLRVGRIPTRLLEFGVPMGGLRLLYTTGRLSGRERSVPVALSGRALGAFRLRGNPIIRRGRLRAGG